MITILLISCAFSAVNILLVPVIDNTVMLLADIAVWVGLNLWFDRVRDKNRNKKIIIRYVPKDLLKQQILDLTREYYKEVHGSSRSFEPGKSFVNYGGRYFDDRELVNLVDSSLDFWLTAGPWAWKFEIRFAEWLGVKYCSLTNSGSSANLLAFMALTSPQLGERRIRRGDEVITVACGFPTTVTPCIQYGAVPVLWMSPSPRYNIDVTQLEAALSPKTKAVMIAHSLGNPFDLQAVKDFCDKHNLWLVEDNCDALGSTYTIDGVERKQVRSAISAQVAFILHTT